MEGSDSQQSVVPDGLNRILQIRCSPTDLKSSQSVYEYTEVLGGVISGNSGVASSEHEPTAQTGSNFDVDGRFEGETCQNFYQFVQSVL